MSSIQFGRLEKVDPRTAWVDEARNFTPWLAEPENLFLLGNSIGIELELEAQEKSVGPFRADILCKDTASGNWVLIENQLARTDHTHLGQLITYAAGLKAVTIVWIANPFTEEHRAALDWLNEISDSRFNFFGLEVELWRIENSKIAPKFNIVCKPNDWSKTVAEGAARVETENLTEAKQLQLQFWTAFRDFMITSGSTIKPTKPLPQHWMSMSIGRSGFNPTAIASFWNTETESYQLNEIRVDLVVTGKNSKTYFAALEVNKEDIHSELGFELNWHQRDDAQMCRTSVRRTVNLYERADWSNQHQWLKEQLEKFQKVFAPRIRSISL